MLSPEQIQAAAEQLDQAEQSRQQAKPLTLTYGDMDMNDAYAIQQAWTAIKQARGVNIAGYKIGLTSRAMQLAMNIDTPDYGVLLDDQAYQSGADIKASDFMDPRIEAEFAFVMKEGLFGEDVTAEQVIAATDYVVPALELIAARSQRTDPETGYTRKVFDTVADNAG
ncbi:MAG: 2-oxo-hepta-3-ene-1,7-dioic acid hydratase, partial [Pseudomonadota bacterium]